ncbi:putative ribonuclease H-like domain-containing protein [Tanacetum coccineum]
MDDFCKEKCIKREYSVARTPLQNGIAERRNRTLIEAARTILGKFDGKSDEGFFVGYSLSSKAFRVYNTRTRRVEENLHIGFLENKPMIEGNGPKWLFDIDSLTQSMNYVPVAAGTITNESADASYFDSPTKDVDNGEPKSTADDQKQDGDGLDNENDEQDKFKDDSSTKDVNAAGQHVNTACPEVNTVDPSVSTASSNDQDSPKDMFRMGASHTLKATLVEFYSDEDEPKVDLGNITNSYTVLTTPNTIIHKDHPIKNVIDDVKSSVQTRRMTKPTSEQGFLSDVYEQKTHDTLNTCLYACFLSHIDSTSIAKALSDSSWVEAMQEELLQFKLQHVWKLVDLPNGKRAIRTKWVFRNKKDERGIVIRNTARLVAQGHRQEEGVDYEEVFAPTTKIEAIRLFLAYASFMDFLVYQMDVKSAFLYGTIEEEVYVTQPPGFKDPDHPDNVYKVVKALYRLHQAPRAWSETLANYLLGNGFKRGKTDQTLFIKKQKGDILLVQVYVDDIIFGSTNKELCTAFEKLMKDNTDTECLVLSPNFKLPNESQILLKIPRKDNMYSFDMTDSLFLKKFNFVIYAKATLDEHCSGKGALVILNLKYKNKLVKDNLKKKIKREYSVARTPQQNGLGLRGNRTTQLRLLEQCPSTKKEEISQDCIVMPIWKDASYFDSPSKNVGNGEPKSVADDQKRVEDGPDNENDEKDKYEDDSSPKEVNTAGQYVNTASPEVNTGHFKFNTVDPSVNTASSSDPASPKDMFTMGASHTLEPTYVEFFSDEDEPEVDLENILNSYTVPTIPNIRIHKDHLIKNVIGDVKSFVQTRRMTKPTSEQGFLSAVEAMQEELLQFKLQQEVNNWRLSVFGKLVDIMAVFKTIARIRSLRKVFDANSIDRIIRAFNLPSSLVSSVLTLKWYNHYAGTQGELNADGPDNENDEKDKYEDDSSPKEVNTAGPTMLILKPVLNSTNKDLCTAFEKLMKYNFQMSSMGELSFFLGLQVQQKEDGIFISQDKYVAEILKKFNYTDVKSASTPVDLEKPLVKDGC